MESKIFDSLNPGQQQLIIQVNNMLISSTIFSETLLIQGDNNDKLLCATPKWIFADMCKKEDTEDFLYSLTIPAIETVLDLSVITNLAYKISMGFIQLYVKGNRELLFINQKAELLDTMPPAKEEEEIDNPSEPILVTG